jgi:hypothetical protein
VNRDLNQLILARKGGAKMNLVGAEICWEGSLVERAGAGKANGLRRRDPLQNMKLAVNGKTSGILCFMRA